MKHKVMTTSLPSVALLLCLGGIRVPVGAEDPTFRTVAGGMKIKDLKVGKGFEAQIGQVATIHFIGWVDEAGAQGKEIFSSRDHGQAVSFLIGTDKVMPAWNEGVLGMKPGGQRRLLMSIKKVARTPLPSRRRYRSR